MDVIGLNSHIHNGQISYKIYVNNCGLKQIFSNDGIEVLKNFGTMTHLPLPGFKQQTEDIGDYFTYNINNLQVDISKFKQVRGFEKSPLWVYHGASNLGKTFLAQQHSNVYESDSNSNIPNNLDSYTILVIGNKHGHTIKDFRSEEHTV